MTTKKFEVTITTRSLEAFKIEKIEKIEADEFLELMSKFSILLLRMQQDAIDDEMAALRSREDDIPF